MTQFQIDRSDLASSRVVAQSEDELTLEAGQALLRVERLGFSANNITYAVLGERLGYWKFFPAAREWGVLPMWGFAEVVSSRAESLAEGDRIFGFFPAASHVVMTPQGHAGGTVLDAAEHRSELPRGYNSYQRIAGGPDPEIAPEADDLRMLLFPLFITSWALWDSLAEASWHGAEQLVIVSASSKTAIGLAQALSGDSTSPPTLGITSAGNRGFVEGLGCYDTVASYDEIEDAVEDRRTVIVDMSGSGAVLGRLHRLLGDSMIRSVNVGLTHWDDAGGGSDLIRERSEMFFAPGVIQARLKQWGPAEFARRTEEFLAEQIEVSQLWLRLDAPVGLEALPELYAAVRSGSVAPDRGIVIAPGHQGGG